MNTELHQQACHGNADSKRALIEKNMPLVLDRVECFLRTNPKLSHLRDDLISEGFLGLTEAVETLCRDASIEKPSGYLVAAIQNAFGRLVESEVMIYYSRFTAYRAKNTGRTLPRQTTLSESGNLSRGETGIDLVDAQDLLASCCQTERDQRFVALRLAGCSVEEIATEFGVTPRSVYRLADQLQSRVEKRRQL